MKKVFTQVPDDVWEFFEGIVNKLLKLQLTPTQNRLLKFTKANLEFRHTAPLIDIEISLHFGDVHYYFQYYSDKLEIRQEAIERSEYGTDSYSNYWFEFEGNDFSQMEGDLLYLRNYLIEDYHIEEDEVEIYSDSLGI